MRLAWFTPWPPQQTGVAGRSAELVPRLAGRGHAVDVFADEQRVPVETAPADPPAGGRVRVLSAHDFVWRQARGQYDLAVYQVGNSRHHQFLWPYLFQYPGLAVLHDTRVHHARGHALLSRARVKAYRAEFAWCHPATRRDAAELGVRGFDGVFYSTWPMLRGVLAASRRVAAHSRGAARMAREGWPAHDVGYIALGEGAADEPSPADRLAARRRLGLPDEAVAFGVFGALTEDKRLPQVVEAFTDARRRLPDARLVLAGRAAPALRLNRLLDDHGVREGTVLAGVLDDRAFDAAIAAVDAVVALRWPSSGETSGPWLRALAAARPTVVTELEQIADVPTLDPRSMQPHAGADAAAPAPIALSIDILDEVHSLALALRRLGESPELRERLGRAARSYWETEHTLDRMADDYERALADAAAAPAPAAPLPSHLRPDPLAHARELVASIDPALAGRLEDLCGSR